jgi:peptidoglycan-associated lipoprotein
MSRAIYLTRLFTLLLLIVTFGASCSKSKKSGTGEDGGETISDEDLDINSKRFGANGNIPLAAEGSGAFPDVHFDYDSSVVNSGDYDTLKKIANSLIEDSSLHADIEGHCDKRGTAEYNLALGEERAKSVATILLSFGVPASQLSTISYGEEIPLDPRETAEAFAKNRRAHFAISRAGEGKSGSSSKRKGGKNY